MGEDVCESMFITKIFMSFPEKLKHFISAWESTAVESQTLQELTSRLLIEEERINLNENVTALSSKSDISKKKQNTNRIIKCFACNKTGHIAKNCTKVKEREQGKEQRTCYGCKKSGHILADCRLRKGKEDNKKKLKEEETDGNAFIGETCALN